MRRLKRIRSQFKMKQTFILRDFLAMERTTLANERTLFSYIRSGLYLSLGGIAILELEDFQSIKWLAYVLFGISLILVLTGFFDIKFYRKNSISYMKIYQKNKI